MKIELLEFTPSPEKLIEKAGRTCYKSEKNISEESAGIFCKSIIKRGHESVLEHASATFKISEISRACSHQIVRSRIASFCQESQRYVKQTNFNFVVPESIKKSYHYLNYLDIMAMIKNLYSEMLLDENIKPEDARFILPNACHTEIVMTMNFREFRHFLKTRLDLHAQWEIRQLAELILDKLKEIAPNVFEDIKKAGD